MSQIIKGSFCGGQSVAIGEISPELVIPSNVTSAKLTTTGLDASNTLKTQKTTNNGHTWADQTTFNADQTGTVITVAHGEQWRVVSVAQQAGKVMTYELSAQS